MTLAIQHLTLTDLFNPADLTAAIEAGHITRKPHPTLPLSIYTYTAVCQYGHIWTPVTMQCRGLIADDNTGRIVALPFPKIFVTAMHGAHDFAPALPAEPFEVFEKADGSLAIVYFYDGQWRAASKGSFISEQAQWAQQVLDRANTTWLNPELTYLAEAIYPGNRIVVDYGQRQDLVLLAAFRPADGSEELLSTVGAHWAGLVGSVVRTWGLHDDVTELEKLAATDTDMYGGKVGGTEEEGYVVRYASGARAKIKLSAYLTLHRLYTGTNERTVWEALSAGLDLGTLFDRVPDEFRDWVQKIGARLGSEHARILAEATGAHVQVTATLPAGYDRKTFAMAAAKSPYRAALFLIHDGKDKAVSAWAWKQIKPRGDAPFKTDEEG